MENGGRDGVLWIRIRLKSSCQLAELTNSQTSVYYDDRKIEQLRRLRELRNKENPEAMERIRDAFKQFEGFEHNYESPRIQYLDTNEPPPALRLTSSSSLQEELIAHNVMVVGDVNDYIKNYIFTYCKADSRKGSDEFEVDFMSPLRSKVCLDIAVKRVQTAVNQAHVIKFLMYDFALQNNYAKIIEIYVKQCSDFIFITKAGDTLFEAKFLTIHHSVTALKGRQPNFYLIGYSEGGQPDSNEKGNIAQKYRDTFRLIDWQDFSHINKSLNQVIQLLLSS